MALHQIDEVAIEKAVKESCVMICILHDEIVDSDWCRSEWKYSKASGVPLLCVVDMQRSRKDKVIDSIRNHSDWKESDHLLR